MEARRRAALKYTGLRPLVGNDHYDGLTMTEEGAPMPRESKKAKVERAVEVCRRLDEKYGPVECFLDHTNPFRLVISVLLSAQTTDAQVNRVTPELFRRFPTPEAMAAASPEEVAEIIRSLGFYKTKAWAGRPPTSCSTWALASSRASRWTRTSTALRTAWG